MDEMVPVLLFVFVSVIFYNVGGCAEGMNWRVDCLKASVHVSNDKVYDCKVRP